MTDAQLAELFDRADDTVPAASGHLMFKAHKSLVALRDVADAVCKQFSAAGIGAVIGSPNPAEDLHARAILARGGTVKREHITDGSPCWCDPTVEYRDPDTGAAVIVHREMQ